MLQIQVQIQILQTDKAELERDLKILNEKLSFALSECNAKDELVEKHAKMAQEALAGYLSDFYIVLVKIDIISKFCYW